MTPSDHKSAVESYPSRRAISGAMYLPDVIGIVSFHTLLTSPKIRSQARLKKLRWGMGGELIIRPSKISGVARKRALNFKRVFLDQLTGKTLEARLAFH